jgi:hypothetical protein
MLSSWRCPPCAATVRGQPLTPSFVLAPNGEDG